MQSCRLAAFGVKLDVWGKNSGAVSCSFCLGDGGVGIFLLILGHCAGLGLFISFCCFLGFCLVLCFRRAVMSCSGVSGLCVGFFYVFVSLVLVCFVSSSVALSLFRFVVFCLWILFCSWVSFVWLVFRRVCSYS